MNKNNSLTFALVIISSGIIVAIGVLIYRTNLLDNFFSDNNKEVVIVEDETKINPIDADDHILGNPDADIVIIEYADFECPACKEFHNTMRLVMDQFGQDGRIAWIYRQSPLKGEESNSMRLSLLSECISANYNNVKFWKFVDEIFDNAPDSLEKEATDSIVENLGLDLEKINSCVDNLDTVEEIKEDLRDRNHILSIEKDFGTPFNIIKTKTDITTFSGSIPYIMLIDIIEQNSLGF